MLWLVFESSCKPDDISDVFRKYLEEDPHWYPIERSISEQCVAIQCPSMTREMKEAAKLQVTAFSGFWLVSVLFGCFCGLCFVVVGCCLVLLFFCGFFFYNYSILISKGKSK